MSPRRWSPKSRRTMAPPPPPPLRLDKHKEYLRRSLDLLPSDAAMFDYSRLNILYFAVIGLDILDGLEDLGDGRKSDLVEWVYRLQLVPSDHCPAEKCGFMGSTAVMHMRDRPGSDKYCESNVAMTYMALCILVTLGDDLGRVHRSAVLRGVASLQRPDGSFNSNHERGESDLRFVYCALAICRMLDDRSAVDVDAAVRFISRCLSYDGAFSQNPGTESHGGSTYCAIASLSLLDKLNLVLDDDKLAALERWSVNRQTGGGFQGRPNKEPDTCYSFWLGATLSITGSLDRINKPKSRSFVLNNAAMLTGGFSKNSETIPDVMHTCLSLCGLSLIGEEPLRPINPALNITVRAADCLKLIQCKFRT